MLPDWDAFQVVPGPVVLALPDDPGRSDGQATVAAAPGRRAAQPIGKSLRGNAGAGLPGALAGLLVGGRLFSGGESTNTAPVRRG